MEKRPSNKTASIVLFVCGFILIFIAVFFYNISDLSMLEMIAYGYDSDDVEMLSIFAVMIFLFGVYAIVMGIVKSVKASHESNVDTAVQITYNSDFWKKSSPSKSSPSKQLDEAITSASWHCPKCNRDNANYVGTCGCGERKPAPNANHTVSAEAKQESVRTQTQPQTPTQMMSQDMPQVVSSADKQQTPDIKPHVKTFCPYCGEKVVERQVYCSICGEKLK